MSAPTDDARRPVTPGEPSLELIATAAARLRGEARSALGVTGDDESPPLRAAIRESGVGWYPLVTLGLLVMVDEFQGYIAGVLAPEIVAGLGISRAQFAFAVLVKTAAITIAVLPMAAAVQRVPRRALLSVTSAFAWSVLTIGTAFVVNIWELAFILVAGGVMTGTVRAIHTPLLVDSYPPTVRVRALAFYRAADGVGSILAPLLVGLLVAVMGLTWRGAFVALGLLSLMASVSALGLRDPGFGKFDTQKIRDAVREDVGQSSVEGYDEVDLGFWEVVQRLLNIPTIRGALAIGAVMGMFLVPLYTYLGFYLVDRWGLGPGGRGVFGAIMPVFAIGLLYAFSKRGEQLFRRDPALLIDLAGWLLAGAAVLVPLGIYAPVFPLTVLCLGLSGGLNGALAPALNMVMLSIVPPKMRPHMAAIFGVALAAVGGFGGLVLLSGMERRYGTSAALAVLCVPGVIAGLLAKRLTLTINDDMNAMIDTIIEEEEIRGRRAQGHGLPMLACRHIDFSYGPVQVLFDVDFTVDDGEIVALLGTNGAGKSTLLRVIAGLGLPTRGSVRFQGADVTYVSPERRTGFGITSIAGGKAVFSPMTVVENLRVFGATHARDRRAVDAGIEASFEAFPRLADRRDQTASTLSGGEQQMLALAKALIVRPRLLLIDELSLGLAPVVVSELLEMVRRINAAGTAVVLVEQSVNVSLSVVEHAYFMEKGEIRFDGKAGELLARPDLLRSVFLHGAAKGFGGGPSPVSPPGTGN